MIPDWKLERYRLGELDAAEKAQIEKALETDAGLRGRVANLEASDAEIRAQYPTLPSRSRPVRAPEAPVSRAWLVPVFVAVAAAVLAVVFIPRGGGDDDTIRIKGDVQLRLFKQAAAEPERLADGARVKPHDVVQVAFELGGAKHVVVASVDGAGQTTLHWPADGQTSAPPGFKALPSSFELDEAPGFERFFLVVSAEPLSTREVLDAVRAAGRIGSPALGNSVTVRSLLLQKESP